MKQRKMFWWWRFRLSMRDFCFCFVCNPSVFISSVLKLSHFIALWFFLTSQVCLFYILKTRPLTSKKITPLWWSGAETTVSLRSACTTQALLIYTDYFICHDWHRVRKMDMDWVSIFQRKLRELEKGVQCDTAVTGRAGIHSRAPLTPTRGAPPSLHAAFLRGKQWVPGQCHLLE